MITETYRDNQTRPAAPDAILITDNEAAALLGVSRAHVHRLRAGGRFPNGIKLGRALRFDRAELTAWVAAGCPEMTMWTAMKVQDARRRLRAVS
jgi:excisionase family DNA binding protein